MNILVIGGTGHSGGFLVRDLVAQGHNVTCVSRGDTDPSVTGHFWQEVQHVHFERERAEEDGQLADLLDDFRPEVVVDIICYEPESARKLFGWLNGKAEHVIHVGTAWIYGSPQKVPTPEDYRGVPLNDYARKKLAIQDFYLARFEEDGFPVTIVNPTQITGAGKPFVTPEGDKDLSYLELMMSGLPVPLPARGEPLVQHVHPSDVARVIRLAIEKRPAAVGRVYNASSAWALTYRGLFVFLRDHLQSPSRPQLLSLDEYQEQYGPNETVRQHMIQSSCVDIRRAASELGYTPAYTAEQAVVDALADLIARGELKKR